MLTRMFFYINWICSLKYLSIILLQKFFVNRKSGILANIPSPFFSVQGTEGLSLVSAIRVFLTINKTFQGKDARHETFWVGKISYYLNSMTHLMRYFTWKQNRSSNLIFYRITVDCL